jgi:hypothetical protein
VTGFRFYLGTHRPAWLETMAVPLFISRRELSKRKSLPRANTPWGLDSGGFTELKLFGRWTISAHEYADEVRRYRDEIGMLDFAAAQDWMCEPDIINGKWDSSPAKRFVGTKLSVREHQRLTIDNYLELMTIAPDLPWMPVIQGWTMGDYLQHVEDYAAAGVDLRALPRVGVGSVCRRQATARAEQLLSWLASDGIKIHAFGFKRGGLKNAVSILASADSFAWSLNAANHPPLPGHTHKSCSNCPEWALEWLRETLEAIERRAA